MESLRIGELADRAGVSVETIRFYERRGLLAPPNRSASGYRQYEPADVDRLLFIRRAKGLGFTLSEISSLIAEGDDASTTSVEASARQKLAAIDEQRRRLEQTRGRLHALVELCASDDAACTELRIC